jgi:glutaminyl-tRNA synthetase
MKDGLHPEGSLSLRLRLSPAHDNPTLRDPIIYRIKNIPHPITKHNHHIYPLYDFTHCLSDSIEGITHSLCTLEFETRRDLYYIILDLLDIHKPFVYEYSRVNIKGNVLSKRKIEILVNKGLVDGWNDPRLLTLAALKRRGFCPASINAFVDTIGCSRNGNK